jgi:sugar (pentulose or hexulose) kinase
MNSHDIYFKIITIIGGLANNKLYCQLISDICKLPVLTAESNDSTVLLGSCICGASNFYENTLFDDLLKQFSHVENGHLLQPNTDQDLDKYHETKYKIYLNMIDDQRKYKNLMDEF